MSLKAFHVVFILACLTMFGFCGSWATMEYRRINGSTNLVMAAGSFTCVGATLIYGWWFLRKLRGIE